MTEFLEKKATSETAVLYALLTLLALFFCGPVDAHEIYVSLCQISSSPDSDSLTIRFTLFTDDLELAVFEEQQRRLFLGGDSQSVNAAEAVTAYLAGHVQMSLNGLPLGLGKLKGALNSNRVRSSCSFVFALPEGGDSLSIRSTILLAQYKQQENLVRLDWNGDRQMIRLNSEHREGNLSLIPAP